MKNNKPVMRVPKEFADALAGFQNKIRCEHGVEVPKSKILSGLAPKLNDLMGQQTIKEPVKGKYRRKKGWRFEFL